MKDKIKQLIENYPINIILPFRPIEVSLPRFSIFTKEMKVENKNNQTLKLSFVPVECWLLVCSFLDVESVKPTVPLILTCKMFYNKFFQSEESAELLFRARLFPPIKPIEYEVRHLNFDRDFNEAQEEVSQPGENGFVMRGVYPEF